MNLTIIIPIWNLQRRGIKRVYLSIYSIAKNSVVPNVIIVDGSSKKNYDKLSALVDHFPFVDHIHTPQDRYNMPMLFNAGIKRAQTDYVFCIGADFIFKRDYFEKLEPKLSEKSFLVSSVRYLPNQGIGEKEISEWDLPWKDSPGAANWTRWCKDNLANGLQIFPKSWFDYCGGYDERMYGWGGMDNDMHNRAARYGMIVEWFTESECCHIYHDNEKASGRDLKDKIRQQEANWKIRDTDKSIKRNQ